MAFASTIKSSTVFGNKRVNIGQFTQASGDTGGAVNTGFTAIDFFSASTATALADVSGTVTITTPNPGAAQVGYWMAIGS